MLTTAQLQTLKTDILADLALSAMPNTSDGAFAIAAAYNLVASPDYYVWKSSVSTAEVKQNTVWTEFIGRTQGERDAFRFMLSDNVINPSDSNIRQGIADIFSGATGVNTRTNLNNLGQRKASRGEKLFASGLGTTGSPSTMGFEGAISFNDVQAARNLP